MEGKSAGFLCPGTDLRVEMKTEFSGRERFTQNKTRTGADFSWYEISNLWKPSKKCKTFDNFQKGRSCRAVHQCKWVERIRVKKKIESLF